MNELTLLIALLITCMAGFMFETFKMHYIFHRIRHINYKLKILIFSHTVETNHVDVFMVNELKAIINKQYVNKHLINSFLLYKKSYHEMRLEYKIGDALQIIDFHLDKLDHTLVEVSLVYNDDLAYPE